jgi:hypothetical protein
LSTRWKAFGWLSGNQFIDSYTKVKKLHQYVLAMLYYSANDKNWKNNDLWLSDIDECDLYTSEAENEICNSQGQLDEIDLDNNRLQGALRGMNCQFSSHSWWFWTLQERVVRHYFHKRGSF